MVVAARDDRMTQNGCGCGDGGIEESTTRTGRDVPAGGAPAGPDSGGGPTDAADAADRWLGGDDVLDEPLPEDVARAMTGFYGEGSVETLSDFVTTTRAAAGGSLDAEDLCHVDGETPHRAETSGKTYGFRCFFDGVALAYLVDEQVAVRTESPSGEAVELRATPAGDVETTPGDAVMSFGIGPDPDGAGDPDPAALYGAVCPYVRAFPSRAHYEGWAAATDAATVGLSLDAGMPVAAALAE